MLNEVYEILYVNKDVYDEKWGFKLKNQLIEKLSAEDTVTKFLKNELVDTIEPLVKQVTELKTAYQTTMAQQCNNWLAEVNEKKMPISLEDLTKLTDVFTNDCPEGHSFQWTNLKQQLLERNERLLKKNNILQNRMKRNDTHVYWLEQMRVSEQQHHDFEMDRKQLELNYAKTEMEKYKQQAEYNDQLMKINRSRLEHETKKVAELTKECVALKKGLEEREVDENPSDEEELRKQFYKLTI